MVSNLLLYLRLMLTFARNSLIRDMTFRTNFIIEVISSISWVAMNIGFYMLIYQFTPTVEGWGQYEFFAFIATTIFVNSIVQTFFLPNAEEFSDLVRLGNLDFALLKPVDTQFLISLRKISWSSLGNFCVAILLLAYALVNLDDWRPTAWAIVAYPIYIMAGVLILYSLTITLAATSIWLGRNQSLYDFWFYITNFSRYPMEIYRGPWGTPLRGVFTFVIPILIVINVPAGLLVMPLDPKYKYLAVYAIFATVASLAIGRLVFQRALASYRSASS